LFYSPTWVGETYFRYSAPSDLSPSTDRLGEIGRIGSLCLVIFSAITFIASVFFPFLIRSPATPATRTFTPRPHPALAPVLKALERFHKHRPDLLTAWRYANIIFGAIMLTTPLVRSVSGASFVVALAGFPWAIACWAPFAFMGVEVNRLSVPRGGGPHGRSHSIDSSGGRFPRVSFDSASTPDSPILLHVQHPEPPRSGLLDPDADSDEDGEADGLISGGSGSGVTSSTG
jgi:solute carrier family 45 protein 1/2/4